MITDREAETLRHIAVQPRRVWGLSRRDFFQAQNLDMPARGLIAVHYVNDAQDSRVAYYSITDKGRKELEEYDARRSHQNIPEPPTAA